MKKFISVALIAVLCTLCALCFVGCKDDNSDTITVRLNEVTHSVFYAPLYVAINQGFFAEEGIEIELTNGGGADKSMTAVVSGQADIGLMGPEAAVYVKAGGSNNYPIVFGQLTKKDGSFLIGRNAVENFTWSSLAGSEIIGGRPGGIPAMTLEYALHLNGLDDGVNVKINYDVQFDLIASAFESGTGDYCTMFEPVASTYAEAGKGHMIASVGAAAGDVPYTCFMATKNYISDNRETVLAFMRAIIKGIDFVTDSSSQAIAAAIAPSFPDTSNEILASSVEAYKAIDAYKTTPVMEEKDFDKFIEILTFAGSLESPVSFSDIIDNSIAEALLAS